MGLNYLQQPDDNAQPTPTTPQAAMPELGGGDSNTYWGNLGNNLEMNRLSGSIGFNTELMGRMAGTNNLVSNLKQHAGPDQFTGNSSEDEFNLLKSQYPEYKDQLKSQKEHEADLINHIANLQTSTMNYSREHDLLNDANGFIGSMYGQAFDPLGRAIGVGASALPVGSVGSSLLNSAAKGALINGTASFVQGYAGSDIQDKVLQKLTNNPDAKSGGLEAALDSGGLGAAIGAVMGAAGHVLTRAQIERLKVDPQVQDVIDNTSVLNDTQVHEAQKPVNVDLANYNNQYLSDYAAMTDNRGYQQGKYNEVLGEVGGYKVKQSLEPSLQPHYDDINAAVADLSKQYDAFQEKVPELYDQFGKKQVDTIKNQYMAKLDELADARAYQDINKSYMDQHPANPENITNGLQKDLQDSHLPPELNKSFKMPEELPEPKVSESGETSQPEKPPINADIERPWVKDALNRLDEKDTMPYESDNGTTNRIVNSKEHISLMDKLATATQHIAGCLFS